MSAADAQRPAGPKARLKDIRVGEVSLVDAGANLWEILVMKNKKTEPAASNTKTDATPAKKEGEGAPPAAPATPETKADPAAAASDGPLMLAPDAKQAMVDSLGSALENISALATTVADAQTQDGAQTPPELGEMLRKAATDLIAIADEWAPAAAGTPAADTAQTANAKSEGEGAPAAPAGGEDIKALVAAGVKEGLESFLANNKAADEGAQKSLEKRLGEMSTKVAALQAQIVAGSLASQKQASNAATLEKSGEPAKKTTWPNDMGAEIEAERKKQQEEARAGAR